MRYGLDKRWQDRHSRQLFPAQSSVLDEEALLAVVADYALPVAQSCRFYSRGATDIYRVQAGGERFYLKVYRPPHALWRAEAEATFVMALAGAGVPVAKPVPRHGGSYAYQLAAAEGPRPALIFEEAPLPLPRQHSVALFENIGQSVALMHTRADGFDDDFSLPTVDTDAFLSERIYYTRPFLPEQDAAFLDQVAARLADQLRHRSREGPGFGLCHADLVLSNLRLGADGLVTLFDFEGAQATWRAYELAVIYWALQRRDEATLETFWQALLRGYASVAPLPPGMGDEVASLLLLRQISFLGGNCASLPLRLGTEPFETGFITAEMDRLRRYVTAAGLLP